MGKGKSMEKGQVEDHMEKATGREVDRKMGTGTGGHEI